MDKGFIILTIPDLTAEIRKAYIHGQTNQQMMEAGLERDEIDDYTNSVINKITKENERKTK